jgi:hypothetical protein
MLLLSHALVSSDFGAHPPWNTIIVVGGTVNFLLLWLLTHVASLWVGFPMWMWGGRALIIQVLLRSCCIAHASSLCFDSILPQHRGDMTDQSSLPDLIMQISGQFASEYMVHRGLQEEVKKAFASGNFK